MEKSFHKQYKEKREPKKMTLNQMIWKLIKLRFKYGNLPVKTWIQFEGFCDLYEPQLVKQYGESNFISIY